MIKRGQMKISFGLIFSIILIIIFIAFAFFGIKKFIVTQDMLKSKTIMNNLQGDIDDMFKSSRGSQELSYMVPKGTEAFCFEEQEETSENYNSYFIPSEYGGGNLNHINWEQTVGRIPSGRLCFEPEPGTRKIYINLEKDYGEEGVTIRRPSEE